MKVKKTTFMTVLVIFILIGSNVTVSTITGTTSKNLIKLISSSEQEEKEQIRPLESTKFDDFNYLDGCIHPATEEIFSNKQIDLELRYLMAMKLSSIAKHDYAVLFLIANEISNAFNGRIQRYHFGYLVEIDNNEAIFIEHGHHLQIAEDTTSLIEKLSNKYSTVLLASCNSKKVADNYNNIYGFMGKITLASVIDTIAIDYKVIDYIPLLNLYYSSLSSYELYVTEEGAIPVTSPLITIGLGIVASWNILEYQIPTFYAGTVSLETGNEHWGAIHINDKCDKQQLPITNGVIHEVLQSWDSLFLIIISGLVDGNLKYNCVAFKFNPKTASEFKIAIVVLSVHPDYTPLNPLSPAYYTILTANLILKTSDAKSVPFLIGLVIEWIAWSHNRAFIYIPVPVPIVALSNAPSAIAGESFDSYLQGLDNDSEERADEIAENAVAQLLSGTWVETVILWINSVILSFCAENSALYYIVWVAVVAIIIAALVWIAIEIIPIIIASLPAIITFFQNLFGGGTPTRAPGFSLLSLNSGENPVILDDTTSHIYDEDSDGIPNNVERNYFELYIEGTPDEQIYIGQEDTWMDPEEDYDGDGLYTLTEIIYNANPFVVDTDGDGLNDSFEIDVEGEPFTFDAMLTDNDGDGNLDTQTITIQGDITFLSNPSLFDSDMDGIGDSQEITLGINRLNRDSDGDGLIDGYEVYAEMFGWNGVTYEDLSPIQDNSNWAASDLDGDGYNNSVESWLFTDPNSIDTDGDGLNDNEEELYSTDPTDADTDRDQLSDGDEVFYNTDPLDFDTDRDLIPDGYEVTHGLNPLVDDTLNDLDGDSLSNWDEYYIYHTHPNDVDTDNDGLDDYEEVIIHNTDPNNQDSDGDNLNDFVEVQVYDTNPNSPDSDNDLLGDYSEIMTHHTDPNCADTDGDDLDDGVEVYFEGTDPLDADTDNDGLKDEVMLILIVQRT